MGYFVNVQAITNSKDRISFEIEAEKLYRLNCYTHIVESPDLIDRICIFNNIIVLLTEDRDFRNGALIAPFLKDDRSENNVTAYDFHGNFLWNIGSIIGDIKMAIDNLACVFKADAERDYGIELPGDAEVLLESTAAGFLFFIDPEKRKLLCRLSGKVK